MDFSEIKMNVTEVLSAGAEKLKDSVSFLGDMKDAGVERMSSVVNDILGLTPLIEVTGFTLADISVDIGIPPGISLSFAKDRDVDNATIDQMLKENEDKKLLQVIVKSLEKADQVQKHMHLANYKFCGLSMKIGLPPDVSLKFAKIEG